jgi:hypothetical protein
VRDTESNPAYPTLPRNLFIQPVQHKDLPEQSSTTPINLVETPIPLDKQKKMPARGGSSSIVAFSFSTRVDKKTPLNVKVDSIGKLMGQENCRIRSASMTIILKGIKAYEVVVDGVVPAERADAIEVNAYDHVCHTASTIFIQVVSQDILDKIVEFEKPYLIWTWLHTEYYRHSAYVLASQKMNLVSLSTQYSGNNLLDFIFKFGSLWLHLTKLSRGFSDSYRTTFAAFLHEDKAK